MNYHLLSFYYLSRAALYLNLVLDPFYMVPNPDSIQINPNPDQANFYAHTQLFVFCVAFQYKDFACHDFVFNSLFLEMST